MKQIKLLGSWIGKYWVLYVVYVLFLLSLSYSRTVVPQFISYAIDSLVGDKNTTLPSFFTNIIESQSTIETQILTLVFLLIGFQTFRAILMLMSRFVYSIASENAVMKIRNLVYVHLQRLPYKFFKLNNTGDLIQRCSTDLDVIKTFLTQEIVQVVWILSMMASVAYQMLKVNVMFTLISVFTLPITLLISMYYSKKMHQHFTMIDGYEAEMVNVISENVTGVQVVKAFGAQKYEFEKYDQKSEKYYGEIINVMKYIARLHGTTSFLYIFQTLVIITSGVFLVGNQTITLGTLVLFLTYVKLIVYPVKMLASLIIRLGRNFVAIDRISEILDEKVEGVEDKFTNINGDINFCNVSFKYPDASDYVLKDVSFTIKTGERVAIIGKTGSGKSTISHLLSRLFDVNKGCITVDGVDIAQINKTHLRKSVGVVVQEPYLFSKRISDNIAIVRPDTHFDCVESVAKIAKIHEDIVEFEDGYNTYVGERGTTLSGGQKQRVAIARMLMGNYKVFVFDDSLSAVDNDTDKGIRDEISKMEHTTTINITHRITSILDCNHIIVLENGKVIEDGTIDELLSVEHGYFKEMYKRQVGEIYE